MSAVGNKEDKAPATDFQRGFTLLELLVVLFIVALLSGGVAWSISQQKQQAPQREAQRLVALLEDARAQSQSNGQAVQWRAVPGGFEFPGLTVPAPTGEEMVRHHHWLHDDASAVVLQPTGTTLLLGPEPVLPPQRLRLRVGNQTVDVGTDGAQAFAVLPAIDAPDSGPSGLR